jgi:predicted nucleic acid-binding protein
VPRYLADTSIWSWGQKLALPDIREKLTVRYEANEVVTCVPVILEAMHLPETSGLYAQYFADLFAPLDRLPLDETSLERALEVQREMAGASDGNHRRAAIDFLIAATAEAAGPEVVLWCFDRDPKVICEHTGQPFEAEESAGPGR